MGIYLHVGFSKTGSSSLQTFLSQTLIDELNTTLNERFLYCVIQRDGRIIYGDELRKKASDSILKYLASDQELPNRDYLPFFLDQLEELIDMGYSPIFSQEDWGRRGHEFKNSGLFEQIDVPVQLIAYVRPQVQWFNSAWWQWFAWMGEFEIPVDVVTRWGGYDFMLWNKQVEVWRSILGQENVVVRLHNSDVVRDFLSVLHIPCSGISFDNKVNAGMSATLIKLMLKYPSIRKAHGAEVDFFLTNHLKLKGKPPWALAGDFIEKVIEATRQDNELLMSSLDGQSKKIMESDRAWWDCAYYGNRKVWGREDYILSSKEEEYLLEKSLEAMLTMSGIR